jgi:adenosine deaminase
VKEALLEFGARRIGHGVQAAGSPEILTLARRLGAHFEVCLTSEIQTGAARSWKRHPAFRLRESGVGLSLNTDDPSICGIRLSDELGRALRSGWSREHLLAAQLEAVRAAFLEEGQKRRLRNRIQSAWARSDQSRNSRREF